MTHWTERDFIDRLYEIGPEPNKANHLAECAECRAKWEEFRAARKVVTAPLEVPVELLVAQREKILAGVGRPRPRPWYQWTPAIALAGMAVFAVLWRAPVPVVPVTPVASPTQIAANHTSGSEAQLMADLYKTAYETVPDSVEPLQGLFEAKP